MTDTPPEWLINNEWLENMARAVSADEGLQQTPEQRESSVVVPGLDGELDAGMDPTAPRATFGPGKIVFSGWVKGVSPVTGLEVGNSWELYLRRVDELVAMFSRRQLVIDHVRPDGVRRAVGKLAPGTTVQVVRERSSPILGWWKAEVRIPAAFWSGTEDVTISGTVASGGAIPLGGLGAGNAPITDALVTFFPGSNPTLVQAGTFLAYDGIVSSGRQLLVDVAARECGPGLGAAWSPLDSNVRFEPSSRWFEIDPLAGALTLNHTGGGQMRVDVTARPKYRTS